MTDDTEHEYDYPMGSGAGLGQCTPEQVRAATRAPTQVPNREHELEAKCAAMRDAIQGAIDSGPPCPFCYVMDEDTESNGEYPHAEDCEGLTVLASDAGKAVQEELAEWRRASGFDDPDSLGSYLSRLTVRESTAETGRVLAGFQDRAEKAERERDALKRGTGNFGLAWDAKVRAQALEEAALAVQDLVDPLGRGLVLQADAIDRIRALKDSDE